MTKKKKKDDKTGFATEKLHKIELIARDVERACPYVCFVKNRRQRDEANTLLRELIHRGAKDSPLFHFLLDAVQRYEAENPQNY